MSRLMKQRLHDALEARQILISLTDGLDFDTYSQNVAARGAVQWDLVSLGEALNHVRSLDPRFAERFPELPEIVGMCNRLVHGYWTISDQVVWTSVQEYVPGLQGRNATILDEL